MGDPNQPIDRYDGRATIHNLEPFEASKDNPQPMDYLTSDEVIYSLSMATKKFYFLCVTNYFRGITHKFRNNYTFNY